MTNEKFDSLRLLPKKKYSPKKIMSPKWRKPPYLSSKGSQISSKINLISPKNNINILQIAQSRNTASTALSNKKVNSYNF